MIRRLTEIFMQIDDTLRATSRSQWLLRTLGALSACAALLLLTSHSTAGFTHPLDMGSTLALMIAAAGIAASALSPDSEIGILTPVGAALTLWLTPGMPPAQLVAAAAFLGAWHLCTALATHTAFHGELDSSALRLIGHDTGIYLLIALALLGSLAAAWASRLTSSFAVAVGLLLIAAIGALAAIRPSH